MHNRLLTSLSSNDRDLLLPSLRLVDLPVRQMLFEADAIIGDVYFMESGFASVVARAPSGDSIEVGIIGREGMVGVQVILGQKRSPHECYIQVSGTGYVMPADDLWAAMSKSWSLADSLLKFAYAFLIQVTHSALANGRFTIEQRLARWLLMAQDRLVGDDVALTHEFLAMMLGVRRSGVTLALQGLEGRHAIRSLRGHIVIRDRALLEHIAGGCYGRPESELAHLGLGPRLSQPELVKP